MLVDLIVHVLAKLATLFMIGFTIYILATMTCVQAPAADRRRTKYLNVGC